jgi:PKD repeat protein
VRIPATLVVALAAVLAGSLVLSGVFSLSNTAHVSHEVPEAKAAVLPLDVIDHLKAKKLAGDAEAGSNFLKVDEEFVDPENHCEFCTRVEYVPGPQGLAGFAYESASGLDLTGAKKVRFWVMGEDGDEKIKFKVAGKSLDNLQERADRLASKLTKGIFKSERFAMTTEEVSLGKDWKKFEVDVTGLNLQGITHPFGFELAKGNGDEKQVVYIKGVVFDTEPAEESLAAVPEEAVEPMRAEIISNGTSGTAPASFEFDANITGGFEPYSINWSFGDGEEGSGDSVTHTFEQAGEYNVTLSVTDSEDQSASGSIMIEVAEPVEQNDTAPPANTTETPEDQTEQNDNGTGTSVEEQSAEEENSTIIPDVEIPDLNIPLLDVDPQVSAGIDLVAQPGDRVLLGGEVSDVDPDTEGLSYRWTQVSGPEAEFDDADSLNPIITIPNTNRDARIVLQLAVDYQGDLKDRDSVMITVDHVDEIRDAEQESIVSSDSEVADWGGECDDAADCMGDDSDSTFAATSKDEAVNLFSFEQFSAENVDDIERVTAIVTAKKTGETGYLSFVAGDADDLKESPGVSILSESFDEYDLVWDRNPVNNRPWTVESLNSFLAGYMYAAGQGDIQVSEFQLVVTYTTEGPPAAASEIEEPEPAEPEDNSTPAGNSTGS